MKLIDLSGSAPSMPVADDVLADDRVCLRPRRSFFRETKS